MEALSPLVSSANLREGLREDPNDEPGPSVPRIGRPATTPRFGPVTVFDNRLNFSCLWFPLPLREPFSPGFNGRAYAGSGG